MPTKMRLQRYGKKGQPYYHIVIADGRAPRDGRFIEKIGTYNPITRPADIQLDFDKALYWVKTGAQPTETVAAILKYTGVAFMYHLSIGVAKGAMTEEQAQAKFDAWKVEKTTKIDRAKSEIHLKGKSAEKKRLEAEVKVNEAKANELVKKRAIAAGIEAKAHAESTAEVAEAPAVVEEPVAVVEETVAEPVAFEEPAVETVAEVIEETASETPETPEASETTEATEEQA
jgi:small subunit ribosomal protein S16